MIAQYLGFFVGIIVVHLCIIKYFVWQTFEKKNVFFVFLTSHEMLFLAGFYKYFDNKTHKKNTF